jgi:tetratricopeptide (TPR) repeat protein
MTDDLYERYKESLRVGHVAVLRGSLNAALASYRTAAEIAPSRALPHTSLGGVLLRLGQLDEALVEFAAAVARAPQDEGALLGQAEALSMSGRKVEAASALDRVSVIQAESNRLPEAADTLRRAMEFSATDERAARQHDLQRRTRLSAGDNAAEQLLARALRLRDEPVVPPTPVRQPEYPATAAPVVEPVVETVTVESTSAHDAEPEAVAEPAIDMEPAVEPEAEPALEAAAAEQAPEVVEYEQTAAQPEADAQVEDAAPEKWDHWWREDAAGPRADAAESLEDELVDADVLLAAAAHAAARPADVTDERLEAARSRAAEEEPESSVSATEAITPETHSGEFSVETEGPAEHDVQFEAPLPQLVGVMGVTGHEADLRGDELTAAADDAESVGDAERLRSMLLAAARSYALEGRFEAALESAHRLLRAGPSDVDTHLVLVELYMARDWNALAQEKLALLERLALLSGDEEAHKRVCGVASRAFPHDERLGIACA